jgi:hypothetical protein
MLGRHPTQNRGHSLCRSAQIGHLFSKSLWNRRQAVGISGARHRRGASPRARPCPAALHHRHLMRRAELRPRRPDPSRRRLAADEPHHCRPVPLDDASRDRGSVPPLTASGFAVPLSPLRQALQRLGAFEKFPQRRRSIANLLRWTRFDSHDQSVEFLYQARDILPGL